MNEFEWIIINMSAYLDRSSSSSSLQPLINPYSYQQRVTSLGKIYIIIYPLYLLLLILACYECLDQVIK